MLDKDKTLHMNEAQMIIDALNKKSKSSFLHYQNELKKQALYFSPFYRDFIVKIINNGSLNITLTRRINAIMSDWRMLDTPTLAKRAKNDIFVDIGNVDALPHELGHAVDFWFGKKQALSSNVVLSNGKTLKEIFFEEFNLKHQEIYELVMNEYKTIINSSVDEKAYDILKQYLPLYNELISIEEDVKDEEGKRKRRGIHNYLYKVGFIEVYYRIYKSKCFKMINLNMVLSWMR